MLKNNLSIFRGQTFLKQPSCAPRWLCLQAADLCNTTLIFNLLSCSSVFYHPALKIPTSLTKRARYFHTLALIKTHVDL